MSYTITLIPGDGIGPEVTAAVVRILKVAKVDIDRNPDAMRKYKIMAVPTLMVFQKGEVVKEIRGAKPKAGLVGYTVSNLRIPGLVHAWEGTAGKPAR